MTTLTPGQEIGPYRVIEQVGKGGMATVYKAHHAAMDRYVAIKILPFQFAQDKEFNERFRREVRVIAKLEHPRILPVYDSGDFQGTPYLVMRYLDAGTLKEHIEAGKLPLAEVDRIFTQLADALAYAHSHEIVHRDIKPSNVMLTRQGDVFLTDFGIAKLVGEHTQFTASGAITGTPAYMSPEQAEGRPIDARADIYALGIVLYEMVTGRVPFEAETPLAVILKHLQAPLPPPSSITEVHPAVEQVIFKALARNREDRYTSVTDLLTSWKQAVDLAKSEKVTQAGMASVASLLETQAVPLPVAKPSAPPVRGEPPQAASQPAMPRRRGWIFWAGSGLVGVALLAFCVIGAITIFRTCCGPEIPPGTPGVPGVGELPENLPGGESLPIAPLAFPQADVGEWESWTGSGIVYAVAYSEGLIYAGGRGGITVYDTDGNFLDHYTVQDGLPDNDVYSLFVDEEGDGSLWAGTEAGLVRFDGEEWILYNTEDGLDNDTIFFVGRVGDLIAAGTAYAEDGGGLNFFDGSSWWQTGDFDSTSSGDPDRFSNKVWSVAVDPGTGGVWVATENGIGLYDWAGNWLRYTTEQGLPSNFVTGLFFDWNESLIVATEAGAAWFDGTSFIPFEPTLGTGINGFIQDEEGRYWFSGGGGIWAFNPENGNWQYFEANNAFPGYSIFRSTIDDNGILYFGTDGQGVMRFGEEFSHLERPVGPEQSSTWGVLESPRGALWFNEEYGALIDVYDPASDTWNSSGLDVCCVVPLAFDAEGNLWGGGGTGVWIANGEAKPINITTTQGLPADQVYQVAFAPGGITWVATEGGVAKLQGFEVVEVLTGDEMGLASDFTSSVFLASDGALWVAREGGASRMTSDGAWESFDIGSPFTESFYRVFDFAEDFTGAIWLATYGDGIYRYANGTWENFTPNTLDVALPSPDINHITIGPDGSVWFSTTYGVTRFDGQTWQTLYFGEGLSHWNVNDVFVQPDGTIWFATSGGITRWRP